MNTTVLNLEKTGPCLFVKRGLSETEMFVTYPCDPRFLRFAGILLDSQRWIIPVIPFGSSRGMGSSYFLSIPLAYLPIAYQFLSFP